MTSNKTGQKENKKHSKKYAAAFIMIGLVLAGLLTAGIIHTHSVREEKKLAEEKAAEEAAEKAAIDALDPQQYVGEPMIASAGGEGIHKNDWSPRSNAPWICVIRAKDPIMRLKTAKAMTQALELHQVGYSGEKEKRQTFYQEAAKVDFDLTKVTAECYTSCTSVASVALRAAGFPEDVAPQLVYSDSLSEKTNLRKHLAARPDLFYAYTTEDYTTIPDNLQAGDILFSEHHVAIVIRAANAVEQEQTP